METLVALQEKIEQLIGLVKELKAENAQLHKENKQLQKKMESLASEAENSEGNLKELSEEKNRTKVVVNDLIKTIDSFMNAE